MSDVTPSPSGGSARTPADGGPGSGSPSRIARRRRVTLVAGSKAGFMIGLDATVVNTALPTAQRRSDPAMAAIESPRPRVSSDCAEFAHLVEAMLRRRQADPARRRAAAQWGSVPRSWTRDELCDVAYSSYRALVRGAIRRPPRREVVLDITDYLECPMTERNQLLAAARYALEHPEPGSTDLRRAVAELSTVIALLPLPAYAVSRDWTVQLINDHLLTVLGLARAEVAGLPAPSRNVLRLLFDPALPVRRLLEPDAASWSRLAAFSIAQFRRDNVMWQYDAWYRALIARLADLPDFSRYWHHAQHGELDDATGSGLSDARITIARADERALSLRPLRTELHGLGYPGIVSFLPADAAASRLLMDLGVPSPANGWGA